MNNLLKLLTRSLMLLLPYGLTAQQLPVVSQYMKNSMFLNPGATGADGEGHVQLLHRTQWAGYNTYTDASGDAPQLQLLTAAFRPNNRKDSLDSTGRVVRTFVKASRHGLGVVLMRDKVASLTTVDAKFSYAYHVPITQRSTLSLGVQTGVQSQSIDYARFRVAHPDDQKLPQQGTETQARTALSFGLWLEHEQYYVGLAADGLTGAALDELGINPNRNWMLTAGYHLTGTTHWKISPSLMVLSNSEEYLLAAGVTAAYHNNFWGGFTYRHEEALSAMVGIGLLEQRRLYLNYAADFITSNTSLKATTSHEVMLGYRWR